MTTSNEDGNGFYKDAADHYESDTHQFRQNQKRSNTLQSIAETINHPNVGLAPLQNKFVQSGEKFQNRVVTKEQIRFKNNYHEGNNNTYNQSMVLVMSNNKAKRTNVDSNKKRSGS